MLQKVTFNLANSPIRHETLHGRKYLVAPMAMLTEGVHNGSNGALLYRAEDIKKAVPAWNMKPIVVYHPTLNAKGVSAADPDVLNKQQVGIIMHTSWDGSKLRAEAWIETDRATTVDDRVIQALEANAMMEVSTGLFTDNVEGVGKYGDREYTAIATNHQPDHLALLPDQVGACSIADGGGLLQLNAAAADRGMDIEGMLLGEVDRIRRMVGNAMSHSNTYSALSRVLREEFATAGAVGEELGLWIVDVYDKFFVYEDKSKLYRLNYTESAEGVEVTGKPEEVIRVTEYRTADNGKFVGNHATTKPQNQQPQMNKNQIIDGLISNTATQWGEDDRETLNAFEEATLNKMAPPFKKKGEADPEEDEEELAKAKAKKKAVANAAAAGAEGIAPTEPITTEAYIESAPAEIREVLRNGLASHTAEKDALVKRITDNAGNQFAAEFLTTKGLEELRGMAALGGAPTANAASAPVPMFTGQATPHAAPTANASAETPLAPPTMNFGREEATA
jgi:hypothetical protein